MFEKLSVDDLKKLTLVTVGPCVSLYFENTDEHCLPTEFEAIVRRAEKLLKYKDHPDNELILKLLYDFNPAEYLTEQEHGIAIFINKYWAGYYLVGHDIHEKVIVSETFHLEPLFSDMQKDDQAYVLTLSPVEASVLYVNGDTGHEVHTFLFQFGQSSNSIHWSKDDQSENIVFRHVKIQTRGRGEKKGTLNKKAHYYKSFFHILESKLKQEQEYKKIPLLVFSGEELFELYKQVTTHPQPYLVRQDSRKTSFRQDGIIHQASQKLLDIREQKKKESLEITAERELNHRVIDDLKLINKAAKDGKIKTLFLRKKAKDKAPPQKRVKLVQFTDDNKPLLKRRISEDILEDIASEVIRNGGEVIVVNKEQMPSPEPAAAILNL